MKLIAPSILSADFANLETEMNSVAAAGADWIHVDVMDGHFVPNLTIGPSVVKALKKVAQLPLDVHLMIEKPERYVDDFLEAGSDVLTIHIESTEHVPEILQKIRHKGRKAGLTLRPKTKIEELSPYLDLCDLVLVMTVEPGFGGQSFMEDQVSKIHWLDLERRKRNLKFLIEVDGGINDQTARKCGPADVFVAGNYIYRAASRKDAIANLKSIS